MQCPHTPSVSDQEYFAQFQRKVEQQRIPVYGSVELTHRCNLKCVHCYLSSPRNGRAAGRAELSVQQYEVIFEDIAEAGCLILLITGGEPLLRKDFCEIYRRARERGMLVTVFTNGTTITDEILDIFQDLPPQAVDITLYGATRETYEKITGVPGSYDRCISGIEALLNHGISVKLKTILMTHNRHEFSAIEDMAKRYGVGFRFDAAIFPRFNGDRGPMDLRVPAGEVAARELSDRRRCQAYQDYFERARRIPATDTLYGCGAGRTSFHIDPYGMMTPCLMIPDGGYDLTTGDFRTGWAEVVASIEKEMAGPDYMCHRCEIRALCDACPAFFRLENGSEQCRSDYLCEMARSRFEVMSGTACPGAEKRGGSDEEKGCAS